jgi:8-oxo-dGTP diphosphatase
MVLQIKRLSGFRQILSHRIYQFLTFGSVKIVKPGMPKFKISLKARLILYDRGRILLLRQTKPNGGNYSLVGGTIERHEDAKGSLIRESFEEAGIIVKKEHLQLAHVLQKMRKNEQRITLYFKATKWQGEIYPKESKKFVGAEWFHLNKLPNRITPTVRHVMKNYRKGAFFSTLDLRG